MGLTTQAIRDEAADLALSEPFIQTARFAEALRQWNDANGKLFVASGELLMELYRKVSGIRDGLQRSTELLTSDDARQMREALAVATNSARHIGDLTQDYGSTLSTLRTAVNMASSGSSSVLLAFRILDYVVLIARTQVEKMGAGQDELGSFTLHVEELVGSGQDVARRIDQHMGRFSLSLNDNEAIAAKGEMNEHILSEFAALTQQLDCKQRQTQQQQDAAHTLFTLIWQEIGLLVGGLQFQDVVRQRLEHTIANLAIMRDIYRTGLVTADGTPIEAALRPAAVRRIAALEIAQLADVAETYRLQLADIGEGLSRIGQSVHNAESLLSELVSGAASITGIAALNGTASILRNDFLLDEKVRQRIGEHLARCVEETKPSIEKLVVLEHELRLAGFNAAVQAAHVQSTDNTIGYIAQVIREQASRARQDADTVRRGVEQAVMARDDLFQNVMPRLSRAQSEIEEHLAAATRVLAEIDGECGAAMRRVRDFGLGITEIAPAVRQLILPTLEGSHIMEAVGAALAAIIAETVDTPISGEDVSALDHLLADHYTMEEERRIFLAVTRGADAPFPGDEDAGSAEDAPPAEELDLDDVLF